MECERNIQRLEILFKNVTLAFWYCYHQMFYWSFPLRYKWEKVVDPLKLYYFKLKRIQYLLFTAL